MGRMLSPCGLPLALRGRCARLIALLCGILCACQAQIVITGVVNNASYKPAEPLAIRSIAAVFGQGLTNGSSCLPPCGPVVDSQGILGTSMAGAQVLLNGTPVPLLYATPGQLGIQVPVELSGATATMVVKVGAAASSPFSVSIAPRAPALFTQNQGGTGAAAVTHVDGTLVTESRPAIPGETVILYGTGLGQTSPPLLTGQVPALVQPQRN